MKIPNVTEYKAIELFTKKYGDDLLSRYEKFQEEIEELDEVITEWLAFRSPEQLEHLLDELSDVQGTFTHLASLMGLYQKEMLHYCVDKVNGREIDPNYKRYPSGKEMYEVGKADNTQPINDISGPVITK
jgi:hypothetical protein